MILVLDVGNTHIHIGLFTKGILRATWNLSTDVRRTADEYALQLGGILESATLEGAILSSVVPRMSQTLAHALDKAMHILPMELTAETKIGIENAYLNPAEVGMDRLANAVAGYHFFGAPLLILSFGTAITLEYLEAGRRESDEPVYRGGVIMPGMTLAAEALARGTAKLPTVDITEPSRLIGRTTAESISSGLINGYLGAIESLVARAKDEIGRPCRVIATGGDALRLQAHMPYVDNIEPDLSLYGLRQIYGINHGCPLPENGPPRR